MTGGALQGVGVLDLSTGVAGPYCTRLLAGLGADVVKVEPPDGDPARRAGPFLSDAPGLERSALFHHLNAGKKSVVLDLRTPEDRATLRSLVGRSHVLVESFPPGAMATLGLAYEDLSRDNPALVVTSITDFGQTGPYKEYRATELIHQALGGLLYASGEPDREPLKIPGCQALYQAGLHAAVAILAALHCAELTGRGSYVDQSVMEAAVSVLENATVAFDQENKVQTRHGSRHGMGDYPKVLLECQDGYLGVIVGGEEDWALLPILTELDELADPRFALLEDRRAHIEEIDALLRPWVRTRRRGEMFHAAQEFRLPFAMVLSPEDLLRDEQHLSRGFFVDVQHPVAGGVTQVGAPFVMSATPWRTERAPLLGEHAGEVLASLAQRADNSSVRLVRSDGSDGSDGSDRSDRSDHPKAHISIRSGVAPASPSPGSPLAGVRVLDLTNIWSGPYGTRLLGDLGAEVIKIEPSFRPDGIRNMPGYFQWLNRRKLGLGLDLSKPAGKQLFRDLVRRSDVVVENFSPRVMPNLELDYAALRAVRSDLIMLSMPAYGSTGPYRDYVGYGFGAEPMAGLAWMSRYDGGPPLLSGNALPDPTAGAHGAVAVLAALRHSRLTGIGQWIDLSQREAFSQTLGEVFTLVGQGHASPRQDGNRHPTFAPHGCYPCAGVDRWVALAVTDDQEWRQLCRAMGQASLSDDARFRSCTDRKENETELDRLIASWTRGRDALEVTRTLQAAGVIAGAVQDAEMLTRDAHLAARSFFVQVPDAAGGMRPYPGMPWHTSGAAMGPPAPAPRLGQHNRQILGGLLGLDEQEIRQLERDGVVGSEL